MIGLWVSVLQHSVNHDIIYLSDSKKRTAGII